MGVLGGLLVVALHLLWFMRAMFFWVVFERAVVQSIGLWGYVVIEWVFSCGIIELESASVSCSSFCQGQVASDFRLPRSNRFDRSGVTGLDWVFVF